MDEPAEPVEVHKKDIDEDNANGLDNPGIDRDTNFNVIFCGFGHYGHADVCNIFLQPLTCQMNPMRRGGNPSLRLRVSSVRLLNKYFPD